MYTSLDMYRNCPGLDSGSASSKWKAEIHSAEIFIDAAVEVLWGKLNCIIRLPHWWSTVTLADSFVFALRQVCNQSLNHMLPALNQGKGCWFTTQTVLSCRLLITLRTFEFWSLTFSRFYLCNTTVLMWCTVEATCILYNAAIELCLLYLLASVHYLWLWSEAIYLSAEVNVVWNSMLVFCFCLFCCIRLWSVNISFSAMICTL